MNYALKLKNQIFSIIDEMQASRHLYTSSPKKDFTRSKKWIFSSIIKFLLGMEGKTLKKELLEYFDYSASLPTASSLVQRRSQIKPEALKHLFDTFTKEALENRPDLSDFLFLAIDGSEFFCFGDPDDADTRVKFEKRNGYNALHLNGLYDLERRVFLDAVVQPIHKKNEHLAAQKMIDGYNLHSNAVVIMDRGYACYNTMAHVEQKGLYYLIRAKDITSCSIVSSLKDQLPEPDCFDVNVHFFVTKKRNKLTYQKCD